MRLFKVSLTLILTNCVLWSYSQQYLLQNNDSLQNKIVEFFRVKQPEIWEYSKMMTPDAGNVPGYAPCAGMTTFEYYKPLNEYDSVYVSNGSLVISFIKKGKVAYFPLRNFPKCYSIKDECFMTWVPPGGWMYMTHGMFWGGFLIGPKHENELRMLLADCYNQLEILKSKELKREYWDDFDVKLMSAEPSSLNAPITEDQRKLIVMANAASDDRDYTSALAFYEQFLKLNPYGYPDAYFNMALISASMDNYLFAISNMKKYMLLVPNSKDSRTAQDKIYEWEYKLNKN